MSYYVMFHLSMKHNIKYDERLKLLEVHSEKYEKRYFKSCQYKYNGKRYF